MKPRAEQVQRLCGIDQATCARVLDSLVQAGFLCLKTDATYVWLTDGRMPMAHASVTATLKATPVLTATRAS